MFLLYSCDWQNAWNLGIIFQQIYFGWVKSWMNGWMNENERMNHRTFLYDTLPPDIWVTWAVRLHLGPSLLRMNISRNRLQSHPLFFPVPHPSCPINHQYQSYLLNLSQIYYLFHCLAGSFITSHLDCVNRFLISFLFSSSSLQYKLP